MRFVYTLAAILTVISFAPAGSARAATASPCKGLDQPACTAKAECTWIKSKKAAKDYCKKKPAKKAAQAPKT
jgi:hypothetical protein